MTATMYARSRKIVDEYKGIFTRNKYKLSEEATQLTNVQKVNTLKVFFPVHDTIILMGIN